MVITKRQQPFHTAVNLQIQGPLRAQFTSPQSKAALNPGSHGHTSSIAVNHCSIQALHNYYEIELPLQKWEGFCFPTRSCHKQPEKMFLLSILFFFQFQFSRKEIKESFTLPFFWPAALQRVCKKQLRGKWSRFRDLALHQHRDHRV